MRFSILGVLRIEDTDGVVPIVGAKRRILLIALLAHANDLVSVDRVVEWLWPDRPPRSAVATVQAHVSSLRRILEPDRPSRGQPRLLVTQRRAM